ncbi:Leucine-rich glioma-inactivated protein 1-like [Oopsacas minuta]|uniref:Leucine-rich glioma-inactivated protein 1-like n=1 Tax=Oopsacas minuta TaxID=111878 RepID=A0AAV7JWR6_9METZ|nr:Leucine-rich glioma-inactivated protein 1-like [Oopsacas minuta]
MLSISSLLILVFLFTSLDIVLGGAPCDTGEISCTVESFAIYCNITTNNDAEKASSVISECSEYFFNSNRTSQQFYIQELDQQTINVSIDTRVVRLDLIVEGNNEIVFISDNPNVTSLMITTHGSLTVSKDFLSGFSNLQYVYLEFLTLDGFPVFYTQLIEISLDSLILPSVVTVTSAMLNQLILIKLTMIQTYVAQWFNLAENAFDNATYITDITLHGIQRYPSFLFANIVNLQNLSLIVDSLDTEFEDDAFIGLDELVILRISNSVNMDFLLEYTFSKLVTLIVASCNLTALDQEFFAGQKSLIEIYSSWNPFECGCDMAWLNFVSVNLSWTVDGTCSTPVDVDGNSITNSSNYIGCPLQSFECFNNTFICPSDSICVNTALSAFCNCTEAGYEFQNETNTCSGVNKLTSQGILFLVFVLMCLLLI